MKKRIFTLVILAGLLIFQQVLPAQNSGEKFPNGRYGIGFQRITWNSWGVSVMFNLTPQISLEGLYGLIGDRDGFGFRGLYRFLRFSNANLYGYGLIGGETVGEWGVKDETGLLIGAGGGIEYNFIRIMDSPVSIGIHVEMGVENLSGYVFINADYTSFIYSAGFHIRI